MDLKFKFVSEQLGLGFANSLFDSVVISQKQKKILQKKNNIKKFSTKKIKIQTLWFCNLIETNIFSKEHLPVF
jgi:hypothetical protein